MPFWACFWCIALQKKKKAAAYGPLSAINRGGINS